MELKVQIKKLVDEGELYDITPVCEAVFGSGVACLVTANLFETLEFYSRQVPSDADSAYTAMLREIKADCAAEGFDGIRDITRFLSESQDDCFCVEILGLPGFYVYLCSVSEQRAILIGDNYEVLGNIVAELHTDANK